MKLRIEEAQAVAEIVFAREVVRATEGVPDNSAVRRPFRQGHPQHVGWFDGGRDRSMEIIYRSAAFKVLNRLDELEPRVWAVDVVGDKVVALLHPHGLRANERGTT